ncbi:MAG: hypothetical protein JSS49_16130 [Planctomycetes bacterium]|nr:hypothetical protein [Planctomycetota bacterium]
MPELTVKALAEFATKPIADQMRILAEQKRPAAGAAQFMTHYYNPTRLALRRYFRTGRNLNTFQTAIVDVTNGGGPDHKRDHNVRAIQSILAHPGLVTRNCTARPPQTYTATHGGVDLRLHPDLETLEGATVRYSAVNYTLQPVDPELARRTLELMYWLLDLRGIALNPGDCELIDLQAAVTHINNKVPRVRTIKNAQQNLLAINQLWPII